MSTLHAARVAARQRGWTLIELVLAVAIAVLVVALLYSVYHTSVATLRSQNRLHAGADEAAAVLRQLGGDLEAAFIPGDDQACAMVLEGGETAGHAPLLRRLAFCGREPAEHEQDLRWQEVAQVTYAVEGASVPYRLLRSRLALAGPGVEEPPVTRELTHALSGLEVAFHDGIDWRQTWPVDDGPALPLAARLRVSIRTDEGDQTAETEVFLPVGTVVVPGFRPE